VEMGCFAAAAGANALLVLPPYYIRPSLAGVVDHFRRVTQVTGLPVIAYNNPPRTAYGLGVNEITEIAAIPGVVAIKDCDRDLASIATKIDRVDERIAMLGGDDDLVYWVLLSGASGAIMATANLAPRLCVGLYDACLRGEVKTALGLSKKLLALVQVRHGPDHPGPLKELMAMAGHPVGPARRPLLGMTENQRKAAATLLADIGEVR
jgi:4-hydroxy-tetrahydrodipicolinate synthase